MGNNEVWTSKKSYDCFKPMNGDIIRLELDKDVIDTDIKQIKKSPYIKINEEHSNFLVTQDNTSSCGRIIKYIPEYYNIREILKFIFMFIARKPKKEYVNILWTLKQ